MTARILVADDDPDMLDAVEASLGRSGAQVFRAANGAEMVQRVAAEGPFDLVITDISMPWMSGLQVARSARGAGQNTPIIVMTALRDRQLARFAADLRALGDDVVMLRKPFELGDLEKAVGRFLPR